MNNKRQSDRLLLAILCRNTLHWLIQVTPQGKVHTLVNKTLQYWLKSRLMYNDEVYKGYGEP